MWSSLKSLAQKLKSDFIYFKHIYSHPQTPRLPKYILGFALAYAVSPIDIIPDFIPILGHLDDAIIIPLLVYISIKLVPQVVKKECRSLATSKTEPA